MNIRRTQNPVLWLIISMCVLAGSLHAATAPDPDNLFDMSLEDLMEVPVKELAGRKGEFMIGVSDVLNKTRSPNHAVGSMTAHETPGRTFFARLQLRF